MKLATITVAEICERTGFSERTTYDLLEKGVIPAIRHGRKWLIPRAAYEKWERSFGAKETAPIAS